MITRRLFLQFLSALPFWRPRGPRPDLLCSPMLGFVFPDGLDGKGEDSRSFLPLVNR